MFRRGSVLLWLLVGWLAVSGCVSTREPKNLSELKEEILHYVDSGAYLAEVSAVARQASDWIRTRSPRAGERLAVVFDIDETMLSNLSHMRAQDFGYRPEAWDAWVERGEAPALEPIKAVYQLAVRRGVAVVFLSGRREKDRPGTEKNLKAIGVGDYAYVLLKADDSRETAAVFKSAARRQLQESGWTIIANLGDQESDLAGGYAERSFKVPAPFYRMR